ncbi:hypothetical protein ACU6TU_03220 [Halomonas sp. LS-001]
MLSEEQYQIEKLANENAKLRDEIDERDKRIEQLEQLLVKGERVKNAAKKLKKNSVKSTKNISAKKQPPLKTYQNCQRCGVRLSEPKPGKKFCGRHQKIESEEAKSQRGWLSNYSKITIYQGGQPGGGRKR